jgi:hypothetical protein
LRYCETHANASAWKTEKESARGKTGRKKRNEGDDWQILYRKVVFLNEKLVVPIFHHFYSQSG